MPLPTHIAILGGGLSGLSSAFYLSRRFPSVAITLLERSNRLGGWVNSERVAVRDAAGHEANVLLEYGPRTLRPNGKAVLELVNLLRLSSSLLTVPKTTPAAKTRFLHIPGTQGLTVLPSSLLSLFRTPLGRALMIAVVKEPFHLYPRFVHAEDADEALEPFLAARLNPEIARILGSALVHGIYAGDSRILSVRAAFPSLWSVAQEGKGSIGRGLAWLMARRMVGVAPKAPERQYDIGNEVMEKMKAASVYSFYEGMSTLVRALETDLTKRGNVKIVKEEGVAAISRGTDSGVKVTTTAGNTVQASHLVSAIPLTALENVLKHSSLPLLPHLSANPLSSVMIVNLVFPPMPNGEPIHPEGFGYLVPRPKEGCAEVLGTVFDSCSLSAQDEYPTPDALRFTKMTMMLPLDLSSSSSLNTASITSDSVLSYLAHHLGARRPLPEPVLFRVRENRACIPVPAVGHVRRMNELREAVRRDWGDSLNVIGAGVGGVSVPDCIEQGRQVGANW